jgi:hypothetical protein
MEAVTRYHLLNNLSKAELSVIHAALIYFLDTEDYTDQESVITSQLLERLRPIEHLT